MDSVPAVHTKTAIAAPLPGSPANPAERPSGCAFHPRCPLTRLMADDDAAVHERCRTEEPQAREIAPGRWSACHFGEQVNGPGGETDVASVLHNEGAGPHSAGHNGSGEDAEVRS